MTESQPNTAPTNQAAIISLIAAILTVLSFCGGIFPIPFTGYVCFPASALMGLVALGTGLISLGQIRSKGGNGRVYAWIGSIVGGLAGIVLLCAVTAGILLMPEILNFIHQFSK